jgi:hypothetical protein
MAIMQETAAQAQFQSLGSFGANDDYCDKKYPWKDQEDQATGQRLLDLNNKCKKSCSGLKCVTNPGLLAAPWTVVGRNARGLPDDSLLGTILSQAGGAIKPKQPTALAALQVGGGFSGYSRQNRRVRRTTRKSKRSR